VAAAAGLLAMSAAACGGPGTGQSGSGTFNEAITSIVNQSDHKGGTLHFAESSDFDSIDPGNTYYAFSWNFNRFFGRTLLTYNPSPGKVGQQIVPDLATGLGKASDNFKTWTYTLKPGVKFEDGTTVTSKDIKYAIERSNYAPEVLSNGPTYFRQYLGTDYKGPYKGDKYGLSAISTPNDTTIVFHLNQPFADFDYLATLPDTVPVPAAKDTGANYVNHPIATGPYMVQKYDQGKQLTLVKNPNWTSANDSVHKQLADQVVVDLGVQANEVDSRMISGDTNIDLAGTGVQAAAQAKVLQSPTLKKNADAATTGFLWMAGITPQVAPFNNIHCRRAVQYAADKLSMQNAFGGPLAGGDIATTVLPPTINGYHKFDLYPSGPNNQGDDVKAKQELTACGKPNGFSTAISARGDRPKEMAAAQGLQQSLAKIGIKADIQQYESGKYLQNFGGAPAFVHQHDIGIVMYGWGADFPDGWGFLQQITDGRAIKASGNSNVGEENNPQVNALLDQAIQNGDPEARAKLYGQIDQLVMQDATILPYLYAKALLYRAPSTTNVYVSQVYGMYDYPSMGVK
jgi:peptide/nickel transport system substrate-binding protein